MSISKISRTVSRSAHSAPNGPPAKPPRASSAAKPRIGQDLSSRVSPALTQGPRTGPLAAAVSNSPTGKAVAEVANNVRAGGSSVMQGAANFASSMRTGNMLGMAEAAVSVANGGLQVAGGASSAITLGRQVVDTVQAGVQGAAADAGGELSALMTQVARGDSARIALEALVDAGVVDRNGHLTQQILGEAPAPKEGL